MPHSLGAFGRIFSSEGFIPRRVCGLWPDWLVWEHVGGNASIWLAYLALPIMIWRLGVRRPDWTQFQGVARSFALFIGLCGLGHFLDMLAFYYPMYRLSGFVLVATGLVSCWTVWSIRGAWPALVAMRSPAELERVIAERTRELTRALDDLRRSESTRADLALIVESSNDAILSQDLDGVITYWNGGAERMFGYSAIEAIGQPSSLLFPPDRQDEASTILDRVRRGETVGHHESVRITKDGQLIDVAVTVSAIKDQSDQILGSSRVFRDITAKSESLRRSLDESRQVAESIPQLAWMARSNGHITWYNSRWYEYTGTTPDQMEGWGWQSVHDPEMLPAVLDVWRSSIASGEPFEMVFPLRGADGRFRKFLTRSVPTRDADGQVLRWFGTNTDIDEQKRAEEKIKASERLYRAIGESIPFGVWICDPSGRNTYASESFLDLVGLTQQQCSEFGWKEVLHPEDAERTIVAWKECVDSEGTWDIEHRFRGVDGEWHPILARGAPVRDDQGRIVSWAGINLDIGRLKRAEHAFRESEERQRRALSFAKIAHWEFDVLASAVTYHDGLDTLYGSPGDTSNRFLEKIHPDDIGGVMAAVDDCAKGVAPFDVEFRVIWLDGSTHWLAGKAGIVPDGSEAQVRMVGINIDITERKLAEEQIRRLNEDLERLVSERTGELRQRVRLIEQAHDAIFVRSKEGEIRSWNQGAERLYGWSKEEAVGRISHEIINTRFPKPLREIEDDLNRLGSWDGELSQERRDGSRVVVASRWVLDREGAVDGAILEINSDITQLKEAEVSLREARDLAMAATRAKSEFLANMSHEIRTPMNGVLGMADLLLDTPLNDLQRNYAETIHGSGEALLTVINDILDFSKIEAGKLSLEIHEFNLQTVMEEVADLLTPRARQKKLVLRRRFDPKIPRRLLGDPDRIRQVLTNLVGNAIKFTDRGEVGLEATLLAVDEKDGATLRIQVRDTGIGIPEARQVDIFESFTQVDSGPSRRHGGTGLGLAISQNLVSLMGGRMGLTSVLGQGSTFWFEVNFARGGDKPDPLAPRLDKVRVLVVDDQLADREAFGEMLVSWECRPELVASGAEALTRLLAIPNNDRFGVIVIDQEMPGMDGEQTARFIKAMPRHADIPLVLIGPPGTALEETSEGGPWAAKVARPVRRSLLFNTLCRVIATHGSPVLLHPNDRADESKLPSSLRILLAEDNEINRQVAIGMIERLGCVVEAVWNGREALEALDRARYDLVLMDIQMPVMDGLEATAAIRDRQRNQGPQIPIIAMTAHAMAGDRERCLAAGMDDYLSKPVRPGPLREALLTWGYRDNSPASIIEKPPEPQLTTPFADGLRAACGNDPKLTRKVLEVMLAGVPLRMGRLDLAVASKDVPQVLAEAHSLKGAFGSVGADPLALICQEVMTPAHDNDFAAIEKSYRQLRDHWEKLEKEATNFLRTLDP